MAQTAEKRRKVGIMGGTFNPIHIGHLLLAENAYTEFGLDEVLFIPSGCSYMKEQTGVLPASVRMHMTQLAVSDNPHFCVSSIEIDRPGRTYTCETLEELALTYPDTEYFFLVGADSLAAIETWKCPERIFGSASVLAAVRDSCDRAQLEARADYLRGRYAARIHLIPAGNLEISSSDIRRRLQEGRSIRYLVPDSVREYIIQEKLYQEGRLYE